MILEHEIAKAEERATAARLTMAEVCTQAGVAYSSWWRWKKRGAASIKGFRKLEAVLDSHEAA